MLSLIVVWLFVGFFPENPAELVDRLNSNDASIRNEAEGLLEETGRRALPALQAALKKMTEPHQAQKLADLINLIERKRLLQATTVELVEQNTTLSDAVADLSKRARLRLALDPPQDPIWLSKKLDYTSQGPITFWEAVDRLGAVGGFRFDATSGFSGIRTEPMGRLIRSDQPPGPVSYAGPYRIELVSLNRHRKVTQVREKETVKPVDEFTMSLNLTAESEIIIERNGSPRLLQAVDDRGTNLRPATTFDPMNRNISSFRAWRNETLSTITYKIPLGLPANRGGIFKQLRGELPINAVMRTGPLMTVPLQDAVGRQFQAGGITLTIQKVERLGTDVRALQINVRGERARLTSGIAAGPRELTMGSLSPGFHPDDHIQILDNLGRPFPLNSNIPPARPDGSYEFRVAVQSFPPLTAPTTLRYFGVVGEAIEVPFEFKDIPMP